MVGGGVLVLAALTIFVGALWVAALVTDRMDAHDEATAARIAWEAGRDAEARCHERVVREYGRG
jgi:hypothetical protein